MENTPLSPAAQAVLDAYENTYIEWTDDSGLIAAIFELADQVVPEEANAVGDKHDAARHDQWLRIRYKLLAIATELENQP